MLAFACHLLDNGTPSAKAMLQKLEHPDLHFTYPTIKLPSMGSDHMPVSDDFAKEWNSLITDTPYFGMDEWMQMMGGENQQAIITAGESDELVRKLSLKSSQRTASTDALHPHQRGARQIVGDYPEPRTAH